MAVLTSILPPMAPVGRTASARFVRRHDPRPLRLAVLRRRGRRRSWRRARRSQQALPSRTPGPGSPARDPLRPLKTSGSPRPTSGSGPSTPRSDPTSAPTLRRRALFLLLAVVLAVVGTALFFAVGYGALDRFLPASLHAGPPALSFVGPGLSSVVVAANRR